VPTNPRIEAVIASNLECERDELYEALAELVPMLRWGRDVTYGQLQLLGIDPDADPNITSETDHVLRRVGLLNS
jgi:predicted HAD superfamily Cof-like phosphohydrolase